MDTNTKTKTPGAVVKTVTILLLLSFILSALICLAFDDAFSLTATERPVTVVFDAPAGMWAASGKLRENGLIRSRVWFCSYVLLRGKRFSVEPGTYVLNAAGGFDTFADRL